MLATSSVADDQPLPNPSASAEGAPAQRIPEVYEPGDNNLLDHLAVDTAAHFAQQDTNQTAADPFKDDPIRPRFLEPPLQDFVPIAEESQIVDPMWRYPNDAPLGFTGPSSVLPSEGQETSHFLPVEDRWRLGFPEWDRYGKDHPRVDDYPYVEGNLLNPYKQNVLKGDYPIAGQHTFLNITATSDMILETRQTPIPTTPFESQPTSGGKDFFGDPDQFFYTHYFTLSADLNHGDAAFKPTDWRLKLTPIFNINYLDVNELGVVNPNVRRGTARQREDFALEDWFYETKLADLGPDYDFLSFRGGSQPFVSDFRGFIFSDINRGIRLFGTRFANRDQFNLIAFDQTEKNTNSGLNTFDDRHQNTVIANYYRQDFIWPGYTGQLSFHFNHDDDTLLYDRNDFLVRPEPTGVFQKHQVNSYYLGWAGDGHINRFNISHAFYYVLGKDSMNPYAGRPLDISAQMAALELSYDRDWVRFRSSLFFASGDDDLFDSEANGFDAIFDNPNFAGGEFSFWQRNTIKLLGTNLKNRMSLLPDLRTSKIQGQTNFVNPGLGLVNLGMDFEVTPKIRLISNVNFLSFANTEVLEQFVFQDKINSYIGCDMSIGTEYRPLLNNNIIILAGISGLITGEGFKDLYNPLIGDTDGLFASFLQAVVQY